MDSSLRIKIDSKDAILAKQNLDNLGKSSDSLEKKTGLLSKATSALNLQNIVIGATIAKLATESIKLADTYTNMQSRLRLVTKSTAELNDIQEKLFQSAQRTRTSFEGNVELYSRIAQSTESLGLSSERLLAITETINKAGIVGGGSAEGIKAALIQLGQGFTSGTLRGEELNSVLEQMPRLSKAIANGMGVQVGALKSLAEQGKITSEELVKALESQANSINKDFAKMVPIIGQAMEVLSNSALRYVGEVDKATGASKAFSEFIMGLSQSLDILNKDFEKSGKTLFDYAEELTKIAVSIGATTLAFKAYNSVSAMVIAMNLATTGSFNALNSKILLALTTQKALNLAMKATPYGLIASGIYLIIDSFIELNKRADTFNQTMKDLDESSITRNKRRLEDVNEELKELDKRFKGYNENQKMIYKGAYDVVYQEKLRLEKNIELAGKKKEKEVEVQKEQFKSKKQIDEELKAKKESQELEKKWLKEKPNLLRDIAVLQADDLAKPFVMLESKYQEDLKLYANNTESKKLINEKYSLELEELNKQALKSQQTESMDASQWQDYFVKVGEYQNAWLIEQSEIMQQFSDLTADEMAKLLDKSKENFFEPFTKELKEVQDYMDFEIRINTDALGKFGKGVNAIKDISEDLNKEQELYNNAIKKAQGDTTKLAKIEEKHIDNQINGYAGIAGAMSQMFEQGSKEAASFQMLEAGLAIVSGVRAILTQGSGDPYTSFARMAAMAASVESLLSSANIAFGGTKTSVSSDAFSAKAENLGKGTVLGDANEASESMKNSLEILEEFAQPQFQVLSEMNKSLKTLNERIGGMSSLLIRQGGFAFGEGAVEFDTGFKNNVSLNNITMGLFNPINEIISKIPVVGQLNSIVGGAINSVVGSVFGKSSTTQALTDYGINFNDTLMQEAIKQIEGQAFQTITTVMTSKKMFSKSSSTYVNTYFEELDNEIERQFSLVLSSLYEATLTSGEALDANAESLKNSLNSFNVEIGKISTMGKTGEEIQEQISNIFGKIGDDIAQTAFPELQDFQQIGEGLFETMTRVATGMEVAEYYINRLGYAFEDIKYTQIENKQGDVALEALTQSITKFDEAAYGANNGVVQMIESFSGTTEELYSMYTAFEDLRIQLQGLNKDARDLTSSMILGAGSIEELSKGINDYFENFLSTEEQLETQTKMLNQEFGKLNLSLPLGADGFKSLVNGIDTSTEAGQELFGRLITLSDEFAELEDLREKQLAEIEAERKSIYDEAFKQIMKLKNAFDSMGKSIQNTIDILGGESETDQKRAFWNTKQEVDYLLNIGADLTQDESDRLAQLINDLNSLSINLGQSDTATKGGLIDELTTIKGRIDLTDQILKTQIVDINGKVVDFDEDGNIKILSAYRDQMSSLGISLPSYDVGSGYIQNDQIAKIHSGEMIIPKNFADSIRSGQLNLSSNSGYNMDIQPIRQELRLLNDKMGKVISIQDRQLQTQRNTLAQLGA